MRIVWHRGDLRTHDHPALEAAAAAGPVAGVVVLDPAILEPTSPRRRALFGHNVRALRHSYRELGGELLVREGDPSEQLAALVDELAAVEPVDAVHAIGSYTPYGVHRDGAALRSLRDRQVGIRWHDGAYVHTPGTVRTADDGFYSVFAPFHRRWRSLGTPDPVAAPRTLRSPDGLDRLNVGRIPGSDPDVELPEAGEAAAQEALERFVNERLADYADRRDRLDGSGTSHLSIYINIGVLSPRTAAARVEAAGGPGSEKWLAELAWRDFLADLLYHRPDLLDDPFQPRWAELSWSGDDERFEAWRDGRTGVPAVDAAMRQLRETGWISNRARMVAAQYLTKNMRVDWRRGERVFKHWLLDGDTANNVGNWQWAAGLGVDNAPYFRVMNPLTQADKHDPDGEWRRRWLPEERLDPGADDVVVEPSLGRKAYLDAAERVPSADRAPAPPQPRRPHLGLATDAQLATVEGVGPTTAAAILDGLTLGTAERVADVSGVGDRTAEAVRARFDTDR